MKKDSHAFSIIWLFHSLVFLQIQDRINVKLSDYGISRQSFHEGVLGVEGTPGYQAPEIRPGIVYDEKVLTTSFLNPHHVFCVTFLWMSIVMQLFLIRGGECSLRGAFILVVQTLSTYSQLTCTRCFLCGAGGPIPVFCVKEKPVIFFTKASPLLPAGGASKCYCMSTWISAGQESDDL